MSPSRIAGLVAVAVAMLAAGACTESGDLTRELAVLRLFPVDPGLRLQYSETAGYEIDADPGIQFANWTVTRAELQLDSQVVDLKALDDNCRIQQSAANRGARGNCAGGLVVAPITAPRQGTLTLDFMLELRRVEPLVLDPMADEDDDGVLNGEDNCPLVSNEDQEEHPDLSGVGVACVSPGFVSGLATRDSDKSLVDPVDTISDDVDNCVTAANQLQRDTLGPDDTIQDTIGDACTAQSAQAKTAGNASFSLVLDVGEVALPSGVTGLVTVDFRNADTLSACDWEQGECTFVPDAVRACFHTSSVTARGGCPEN